MSITAGALATLALIIFTAVYSLVTTARDTFHKSLFPVGTSGALESRRDLDNRQALSLTEVARQPTARRRSSTRSYCANG